MLTASCQTRNDKTSGPQAQPSSVATLLGIVWQFIRLVTSHIQTPLALRQKWLGETTVDLWEIGLRKILSSTVAHHSVRAPCTPECGRVMQ